MRDFKGETDSAHVVCLIISTWEPSMGGDRRLIELAVSSPKAAVIISPAYVFGLQVLLLLSYLLFVSRVEREEMGVSTIIGFR